MKLLIVTITVSVVACGGSVAPCPTVDASAPVDAADASDAAEESVDATPDQSHGPYCVTDGGSFACDGTWGFWPADADGGAPITCYPATACGGGEVCVDYPTGWRGWCEP